MDESVEATITFERETFHGQVRIDRNRQLVISRPGGAHPLTGEIIEVQQPKEKNGENQIIIRCKPYIKNKAQRETRAILRFPLSKTAEMNTFLHGYSFHRNYGDSQSPKKEIRLWVTTWNMANNTDTVSEYYTWVTEVVERIRPDMLLFGAQESKDKKICHNLEPRLTGYKLVYERWDAAPDEFGQIKMAVFASESLYPYISDMSKAELSTGALGGMMKNKGAIAVSMKIYASPVCFIVSHLAAHQEQVAERNRHFAAIVEGTSFGESHSDEDSIITSHHHIVWTGDLNYRISLPRDEVCARIERKEYEYLFDYDQLHQCMETNAAFQGFTEGLRPEFDPTYRYYRKPKYDMREYNPGKGRIPAWCDRVLVRSFPTLKATCEEYSRCTLALPSDHRPVYATWSLQVTVPPAKAPLFASVIGVRPRIKFGHISVHGTKAQNMQLVLKADFLSKCLHTKVISKIRDKTKFIGDDIPELTPDMWTTVERIKTLFIRIFVYSVSDGSPKLLGVAIIPVGYAHVDVMRKEFADILHHHHVVGRISYEYMITLVSETRLCGRITKRGSVRFAQSI